MKKFLFLLVALLCIGVATNVDAQTKLKFGVPQTMQLQTDTLDADGALDEVFFNQSGIDFAFSIQVSNDSISGAIDDYLILQYSNDGVNYVNSDTITLNGVSQESAFSATTCPYYYIRVYYDEQTAAENAMLVTIFARKVE